MGETVSVTSDLIVSLVNDLKELRDRVSMKEKEMDAALTKQHEDLEKCCKLKCSLQQELKLAVELRREIEGYKCELSFKTVRSVKRKLTLVNDSPPRKMTKTDDEHLVIEPSSSPLPSLQASKSTSTIEQTPQAIRNSEVVLFDGDKKMCFICGSDTHGPGKCVYYGACHVFDYSMLDAEQISSEMHQSTVGAEVIQIPKLCLNCGKRNDHFVPSCKKSCFICKMADHLPNDCQYYVAYLASKYSSPEPVLRSSVGWEEGQDLSGTKKFCFNCGCNTHLIQHCQHSGGGACQKSAQSKPAIEQINGISEHVQVADNSLRCSNCGRRNHLKSYCWRPGGDAYAKARARDQVMQRGNLGKHNALKWYGWLSGGVTYATAGAQDQIMQHGRLRYNAQRPISFLPEY